MRLQDLLIQAPPEGVDLQDLPVRFVTLRGRKARVILVGGVLFVAVALLLLFQVSPHRRAPQILWQYFPLVHLTLGLAAIAVGAWATARRRSVELGPENLVLKDRWLHRGPRQRRVRLSDYAGIALERTGIRRKRNAVPGYQVVLRHALADNVVPLLRNTDELAALAYQKQAARRLGLPMIGLDGQVRPPDSLDLSLSERIARGGVAFDAAPEPPPEGCFAEADGDALVVTATRPPYSTGIAATLRRLLGPGSRTWRRFGHNWRWRLAHFLFVLGFAGVGGGVALGDPFTPLPLAAIGATLVFAPLVVHLVLRLWNRRRRERLRVSPRGASVCMATPEGEHGRRDLAAGEIEAVELGADSDRAHGLHLVSGRQILHFGADLPDPALAWCRRVVLAHLAPATAPPEADR